MTALDAGFPAKPAQVTDMPNPGVATPPAASTTVPLSWLSLALKVLREAASPLPVGEILRLVDAAGLPRSGAGLTPQATVARDLRAAITRGDSRLTSPGRGLFLATPRTGQHDEPHADTDDDLRRAARGARDREAMLPVAPLAEVIEGRGGLSACGVHHLSAEGPARARQVDRLTRAYLRARDCGLIGVFDVDELAVLALATHPSELYPAKWWTV